MRDNVILYGIGSKMLRHRTWYNNNFNIIAFSDSNPDKKINIPFDGIPYILPDQINEMNYDYIIVCSVHSNQIISYLINKLKLSRDKIYSDFQIYSKYLYKKMESFGNRNKDKIIVIIGRDCPTQGLFWHYNYYIQYINEILNKGYYPVIDMKNHVNIYLDQEELGKKNTWEFYFKQPTTITLEEAYHSANVIITPDIDFISDGNNAIGNIYYDKSIRRNFYEIGKEYIKLNPSINLKIEEEFNLLMKPIKSKNYKILGTLYRGTDFINIKPYLHSIQPTVDEFVEKTKVLAKLWECEYIYMASDDESAINKMRDTFGDKFLCHTRKRFSNTGDKRLAYISFDRENDRYIKGYDYLSEIYLLSMCDSIVAGKAGGTVGALILNGCRYEHEYFFELGLYGINDN